MPGGVERERGSLVPVSKDTLQLANAFGESRTHVRLLLLIGRLDMYLWTGFDDSKHR